MLFATKDTLNNGFSYKLKNIEVLLLKHDLKHLKSKYLWKADMLTISKFTHCS